MLLPSTATVAQPAPGPAPATGQPISPLDLGPGLGPGLGLGQTAEKRPRKFWMPDGKYRELKPGEVRPYHPRKLDPEPEPQLSDIKTLEAQLLKNGNEPEVLARPDSAAPMIGTVAPGSRLSVRGEILAKTVGTCRSRRWLALIPFGWICAEHGKPTDQPASTEPIYQIVPGERVPYRYIMVSSKEPLPMWATLEDLKAGSERLSESELDRHFAQVTPNIQRCVTTASAYGDIPAGSLKFKLRILPSGKVESVSITASPNDVATERTGAVNRLYARLRGGNRRGLTFRKRHPRLYRVVKYPTILLALWLLFAAPWPLP